MKLTRKIKQLRRSDQEKIPFTLVTLHVKNSLMKSMCHKIANASSTELESKLQRQKTPSAIPAFLSNGVYATACLLTITSCAWMKPANKRVAETRDDISKRFQKELYRQENKTNQGALKITWQQGLNKMYIHNPDLIQADYRIADAKQRQKRDGVHHHRVEREDPVARSRPYDQANHRHDLRHRFFQPPPEKPANRRKQEVRSKGHRRKEQDQNKEPDWESYSAGHGVQTCSQRALGEYFSYADSYR